MPTKRRNPSTAPGPFQSPEATPFERWGSAMFDETARNEKKTLSEDATPALPPLTDETIFLSIFFQASYGLDFDVDPEVMPSLNPRTQNMDLSPDAERLNETGPPRSSTSGGAGGGAVFPSGRIPRGQPGLAARRLDHNLFARLCVAAAWAEVVLLPWHRAECAGDKPRLNRDIGFIVGLDRAIEEGLIDRWVILWDSGRYPQRAKSIRLYAPGGRRARARALGELEGTLRRWVNLLKDQPYSS